MASLNIKGRKSGDIDKWMHIPQIIREKRIGILAVQETHLTDELAHQFKTLFDNTLSLIFSPDPETRNARGVALVLNKKLIKTDDIRCTTIVPGRAITINIPWHEDQRINVLAIYAPNTPRETREFWRSIQSKIDANPEINPHVTLGDFNLVEDAIDRIPSKPDDATTTEVLRNFKLKHHLVDGWRLANPEEKGYTWSRPSDGTQSRIDRIYVHEDYFNDCAKWEIEPAAIPTDHDMVSAMISTPSAPAIGKGRWAVPPRLTKNRALKKEIQSHARELQENIENIRERTPLVNPQMMLKKFKTTIRDTLRRHERKSQPIIKEKIEKLTMTLRGILNNPNLPEDEIKISAMHLKNRIRTLNQDVHRKNRDTLAAVDAVEGERIGKTWSNRHKKNKPRDTIKGLRRPHTNNLTRNSKEMAEITARYHEDIQNDGHNPLIPPDENSLEDILRHIKRKTSEGSKIYLAEQITEQEVRNAIRKTTSEKAPGPDGIPIDLWKALDDRYLATKDNPPGTSNCNIVWTLTRVYQDIEKHGVAANSDFHEGCMCPIYKKKDPDNVANYRPITLLNTDYKVYTKALSLKLARVVHELIHKDQAGFIKGRSIFDQVKTTKLVIDYMERTQRTGAIVALDQEKAYDKILHPYLWAVLRKFEIPERLIKTIQALYDNAKTIVMINGELSDPFSVLRGVRQGDALSCLLFDLAIEPLAENIRKSHEIKGIQIPGRKDFLKIKLFADDTTVYLSDEDKIDDLQTALTKWCKVSGAKFNIEKTEIIPLGSTPQREEIITSRKLTATSSQIPDHIHIAKDGEPVRILGAWLGNNVDQAVTWAPILEDCCKRLKRWGAAKHSLEGRRLIIQMQVAGVTQYLTKVQGMPKEVEAELNKQIRRFMWNNEKTDTVNQTQMSTSHRRGGKKVLDIESRNKAIHLTWLKAYLHLGEDRPTWAFFADAIIREDVPSSHKIINDPESRIMPIIQDWEPRSRGSNLPDDLKAMMKMAKELNVQLSTTEPSKEVQANLPVWYHARSAPSVRRLYKTRAARCLRKKHGIRLVRDVLRMLDRTPDEHSPSINCNCSECHRNRTETKCHHPHECTNLAATLIKKIYPKWNPLVHNERTPPPTPSEENAEDDSITFNPSNTTTDLTETITIFGESLSEPAGRTTTAPQTNTELTTETTVFTDGACINNGRENASAGSGVWYANDDPRNRSVRVPHEEQSNQTGELYAILLAVRNHPTNEDLRIVSDSRYAIDGLTKHLKHWEDRGWIDVKHNDLFQSITAWLRWRNAKTKFKWVKGHNGTRGNEEADKLAGEGALKPPQMEPDALKHPQNQLARGAKLCKLEQRDFYKVLRDRKRIPTRKRTERNVGIVQACAQATFDTNPTTERVWLATRHKDLTRKTRDFLWKSTQNAYKIGEYWLPIEGYEQRGTCPICNEQEDMEHILTTCKARARETLWSLADNLWKRRSGSPLPHRLGDILGCGLAEFSTGGKPDKGKNRFYRILVSETAYLIWKLRNERRIRDEDAPEREASEIEIRNRWSYAMNKRLTVDRALTNDAKFGNRALSEKLVKQTWTGCLDNEDELPPDWHKLKEVLVGIFSSRPPGRGRRGLATAG